MSRRFRTLSGDPAASPGAGAACPSASWTFAHASSRVTFLRRACSSPASISCSICAIDSRSCWLLAVDWVTEYSAETTESRTESSDGFAAEVRLRSAASRTDGFGAAPAGGGGPSSAAAAAAAASCRSKTFSAPAALRSSPTRGAGPPGPPSEPSMAWLGFAPTGEGHPPPGGPPGARAPPSTS